jgi:ribonuclease HII
MIALAKQYPEYGFESHVGYGTKKHQEALKKYGPCPIHRRSYRPIREILQLPLFAATLK